MRQFRRQTRFQVLLLGAFMALLTGFSPQSSRSLSKETAVIRSKQVGNIHYRMNIDLTQGDEKFQGRVTVQFDLRPKAADHGKVLAIDLEGAELSSLRINQKSVNFPQSSGSQNSHEDSKLSERYDGSRVYFRLDELTVGKNEVEIDYSHPYSHDGNGLHRFVDPADHDVYLYSHFEPFGAHLVFPCFDQPDLKATYELTVEAPAHFQVIANTLPKAPPKTVGKNKSWVFPETALFSTYLFALHAGPYHSWESSAADESKGIPLRLFARKSLAKYVDPKAWFDITRAGLKYYAELFGIAYPFGKYDQIIVPEFNMGAMENIAAITFTERFIFRTRVTQDRLQSRANVILHEMAHQWFGNLVTMRWWNGLWLNESFATLMASTAVDKTTDFKKSWQDFFAGKQHAYWEDQLVTTHPIEVPVQSTEQSETIFDGITYEKGAATLKQLRYYLGEEEFKEGLQRYFQKYAYKNTSLSEFVKMLAEASGKDLSHWERVWLQTSGVNTVKADWACKTDPMSGKPIISKFDVHQSSEANDILRPHRMRVALFYLPKKKSAKLVLERKQILELDYSEKTTPLTLALGKSCPDFVFLNEQDQDYAKVEFDSLSLAQLKQNLMRIQDPLIRQMFWHSLWEMVTDGKLRSQEYIDLALKALVLEQETLILSSVLPKLAGKNPAFATALKYLSPAVRSSYQSKIEDFVRAQFQAAPGGSDAQLIWFRAFLSNMTQQKSIKWAQSILEGRQKLKGFEMDQERRWAILGGLARNGGDGIAERLTQEYKKDETDNGRKLYLTALASIPDPQSKSLWLKLITTREAPAELNIGKASLADLNAVMEGYYSFYQPQWQQGFSEGYYETLAQLATSKDPGIAEFLRHFTVLMYPSLCGSESVARAAKFLSARSDLPAMASKHLRIAHQEEERCIRAALVSATPDEKK